MTVSGGVYTKNEMKRVSQLGLRFSQRRRQILHERFVLSDVKRDLALLFAPQVTFGFTPGRFDQDRGEIGSDRAFNLNPFPVQYGGQVHKIHSSAVLDREGIQVES